MRQCCGGSSRCAHMDPVRALEDAAMRRGNTLNVAHCLRMGVDPDIVKLWTDGVLLEGHEHAPVQVMEDYPSVRDDPETAARELDRLTSEGKIYWYSEGTAPSDLHIAPTTLIVKQERSRLGHDWTRSGLNEHLVVPSTTFQTMDDFIATVRPMGHMAGLDIRDCFFHWPIHGDARRKLGVRHPLSGQLGCYLFCLPDLLRRLA